MIRPTVTRNLHGYAVAGAPVIKGRAFPSDELTAEAVEIAGQQRALPPTQNVKVIYLHSWAGERTVEFRPGTVGVTTLGA